jgi:hypothetical protein
MPDIADIPDILDKLRAGYPTMSAFSLVAIGAVTGWTAAWLILHQRLKHHAERIEELRGRIGDAPESTTLAVSGPHYLKESLYKDQNRWRIKIRNSGRVAATNPNMKLRSSRAGPKDPSWSADYPYPIVRVGHTLDEPAYQINPGDDEDFEVVLGWRNEAGQFFTQLSPKGSNRPILIEPNERWEFSYDVTATNAPTIVFTLQVFVEANEIKVARIS